MLRRSLLLVLILVTIDLPDWNSLAANDLAHSRESTTRVVEFPMFAGGYGTAFFEESARLYEQERRGVQIRLYGDPRIADQLRIRALEGNYPAATNANLLWPSLIRGGRVLDLSPWLDGPNWEEDGVWRDTFLPGVLERWQDGDSVYALPFAHALIHFFYNRGLFAANGWEVPRTWEEFYRLCDTIQTSGIPAISFPGVFLRYSDFILRAAHFNLIGPEEYRAYQELAPGRRLTPAYARAAEVVQILATRYFMPGYEGMTHTAANQAFFQGRAALTMSGSWLINEMRGRIPPDFDLGAFNFPVFADGVTSPDILQTGSEYFFVFADSPEADLAVDFLRFLTSRERAESFTRRLDSPTALRGVPDEAWSERMRDTAAMIARSTGSYGQPPGSVSYEPALLQALGDARHNLTRGLITPDEFGRRMEAAAERVRQRRAQPDAVEVRHGGRTLLLGLVALATLLPALLIARRRRGHSAWAAREQYTRLRPRWQWYFLAPSLLLYSIFLLWPGLLAFSWAMEDWDGLGKRSFVGTLHLRRLLLEQDTFWAAMGNNLFVMVVPALLVVPTALFFAVLLHRGIAGRGFFQACFLFPNILGGVAATLLWLNIYDPLNGILNQGLAMTGRLLGWGGDWFLSRWLEGFATFPWLGQDNLYPSLLPIYLWMACGFNLILYLAAMDGIDEQLYEAAELDGASPWYQFRHITLPLMRDILAISIVFLVIGGIQTFEMIWLLTAQDPATGVHVLGTLLVTTLFREFNVGQAAAIGVLMFVFILLLSLVVWSLVRRESHE